jgi:choline dehydrogenase
MDVDTFDFIVVGAGSAGCVLADALSADGRHSVAILEAGGSDQRFFVDMPLGYGKTFYDSRVNWGYRAEPDEGLAGIEDYWPRGKILGGSGSINAMVWIHGAKADYDGWAAMGNPGWSHADCLRHFKAIERCAVGDEAHRGRAGRVAITTICDRLHPLSILFLQAAAAAGLPQNSDFNGRTQEGVGPYQFNIDRGRRMSAAKAFLRPALRRSNVNLVTHAHVSRIVIEDGRAGGVVYERDGRSHRILARREVILAAGAINSPHLMQLSGLGSGTHLAALGIEVLRDLPVVGEHLQDHVGINYTFRAHIPTLNQVLRPTWGKLRAGIDYLVRRSGPLSMSLNQVGGFVRTSPDLDQPDIQLYMQAISTSEARSGTRPLLTPDSFPGFGIGLSNCHPTSRGSILARSPDPRVAPAIRANALSTEADARSYLAGLKLIRRIAAQRPLSDMIDAEIVPGPAVQSDEDLLLDGRRRSGTVYHPSGTCRMGPEAATAVVDARLRVHGIEGLRIADTSIMPKIISGNTNAAAMMIGAQAGEMILADAR